MWGLDSAYVSYESLFASSWALNAFGLLCAAPVIWLRVRDTEITEQDFMKKSDLAEVMGPAVAELPAEEVGQEVEMVGKKQ